MRKELHMLETLDSIPWNELGHAYGEATDVPDLIRALASPEPEVVKNAIGRLWYTVIHQGTVYSSTAYVVPFFCELLEAPDVQNKTELLNYLATIARGASYHNVHVREKERRETPEMQKEIAKELSWVQAASDAVSDDFAIYLRLLQSPDAKLRASAAHVHCRCQSHTLEVIPAMKQHFFAEKTVLVRASLLLSLGSLLEKDREAMFFFESVLQSTEDPLVQIAAAMGCAFAMKEQTGQKMLEVLVKGYELPSTVKEQFGELPFADVDFDASVSTALHAIGLSISSWVLPTLTRAIRRSNSWSGLTLVPNNLYLAFGDQKIPRTTTIADLSDLQRDVLTAIYETEELWTFGNMAFAVGNFFEPHFKVRRNLLGREGLGAFLLNQDEPFQRTPF
jgi:hypothetical protein